jgi:predicted transport protein
MDTDTILHELERRLDERVAEGEIAASTRDAHLNDAGRIFEVLLRNVPAEVICGYMRSDGYQGDYRYIVRLLRGMAREAGHLVFPEPAPGPGDSDYTLERHLKGKPATVQELFEALRQGILGFSRRRGEIVETAWRSYVSYWCGSNFCEVEVQTSGLKLHLDIPFEALEDPRGMARDMSQTGHRGTGEVEVRLETLFDLNYVLGLVRQAYRHVRELA